MKKWEGIVICIFYLIECNLEEFLSKNFNSTLKFITYLKEPNNLSRIFKKEDFKYFARNFRIE